MTMTIRLWPRMNGWLAAWWDEDRSAPYDVKFAATIVEAVARLDLSAAA